MPEQEVHVILKEWLLKMKYPKDTFPTEEQLKTVCVGKLRYFWRDVIKNIKPKQEVRQKRLNVFVNKIWKFESVEDSSLVKLGQILPPAPLMQWKQHLALCNELDIQRETARENESRLSSTLLKTKLKKVALERKRKSIEDKNREIYLLKENTRQLKENIQHSKIVSNIACNIPCFKNHKAKPDCEKQKETKTFSTEDFLNEQKNDVTDEFCLFSPIPSVASEITVDSTDVTEEEYDALCDINFKEMKKVDVEKVLEKFDVSKLWNELLKKRDAVVKNVLFMAGSADLSSELSVIARKSSAQNNFVSWKDNLAEMSALHCKLMVAGVRCMKQIKDAEKSFQGLLESKILPASFTREQIEILKLQCKHVELKATIDSFKEDVTDISKGRGIFAKYHSILDNKSSENFNQIMLNLKERISDFQKSFFIKEETVKSNITKLSESIVLMNDIQQQVLNVLGYSKDNLFCSMSSTNTFSIIKNDSLKDASVVESILNLNSSKIVLKNNDISLMDVQKIYAESTTKDDIIDVYKMLSEEINSLKQHGLGGFRKIVMDDGEKLLIRDSLHYSFGINEEDESVILKYLNPFSNVTANIKFYENFFNWSNALQQLNVRLSNESFIGLVNKEQFEYNAPSENEDSRIGDIIKNIEKSLKPLAAMNDNIDNYYEKLDFFSNCNLKQFICDTRKIDDKNYSRCEYEIGQLLLEKSYFK